MSLSDYLVADRQCNECDVCCISLRIENPALTKKADVRCPHLSNQTGCGIYDQRPDVCRTWYCGWRVMPFLHDDMRPDRSKILIKQDETGFVFQPLRSENTNNLTHENVLEAIGALVSNGIEVKTSIPTRPGYCNALTITLDPVVKTDDAVSERHHISAAATQQASVKHHIVTMCLDEILKDSLRMILLCPGVGVGLRF